MRSPRLAWPLAISLALHLCVGWLFTPGAAGYLPRSTKAVTLTVFLASKERPEPLPVSTSELSPPLPAATVATSPTATSNDAARLTQRARILVAPDLTTLEEIPVPFSGSVTLRLHVSSLGTVDRVTVVKSDPVPKELREGLLSRFEHARLAPALAGSEPVASTLDLVIRYETAPVLLPREP